jgi:ribosomal protein S18 acetylase RimI-like enzyme
MAASEGSGEVVAMQPERYRLRPALREELEALYAIHFEAMGSYVIATWRRWDHAEQRTMFAERWPDSRQAIEVGGELAGLLDVEEDESKIFIANLEVHPKFQRRGVGSSIITSIQQRAAERGIPVDLQVLRVNPARGLYERLGSVISGETETHYQMVWRPA